jgi:molybdate transport system ATP-binding protein
MAIEVSIQKKFGDFALNIEFNSDSDCLGILGASGCGKSMTLKCIAGIEKPDSGRIVLNGRVLFDSSKKINLKPQQRNVGYLFQNYALFPNMTVEQNIGVGIRGKSKTEKEEIIQQRMKQFQIEQLGKRYPGQLSGGQQQRVALARILAYEPELIMLDEPFSALDSFLKDVLQQQMFEQLKSYDGNIIMVTHSRDEVYRFCDDLMVLKKGRAVHMGGTKELFEHPTKAEVARLTGCKNITAVNRLDDWHIEVPNWGITLTTAEPVREEIAYVGIRAHDLEPVWEAGKENCMKLQIKSEVALPFEHHYYLKNDAGEDIEHQICWYVQREHQEGIDKKGMPEWIQLPKEALLLLEG